MFRIGRLTVAALLMGTGLAAWAHPKQAASIDDPATPGVALEVPLWRGDSGPVSPQERVGRRVRLPRPPRLKRSAAGIAAGAAMAEVAPPIAPLEESTVVGAYGPRFGECLSFHRGVDLEGAAGAAVRATEQGVVLGAGPLGGLGTAVVLAHGPRRRSRYAHLSEVLVHPGESVPRGAVIGRIGMGTEAERPQLHFEYWLKGADAAWHPQDPLERIRRQKVHPEDVCAAAPCHNQR
jgi:murein DD-endopeptidase MepM/ murein hydrolase activator NlpD